MIRDVPARSVPPDLASVLRNAADLERQAQDTRQWYATIRANSRLMLVCVNAGWQVKEVGQAMGLTRHAASKRVQSARREFGMNDLRGVHVPLPPPRPVPVSPLALLYTPVEGRDWLSASEALDLAGISYSCLTLWRKAGLLPTTRWINRAQALYSRSDLQRVLNAPHTGRGADLAALRAQICVVVDDAH